MLMKVPPIRKIKGKGMPREARIVCAAATAALLASALAAKCLQRRTGGSLDPIEGKKLESGPVQALPTIPPSRPDAGECSMPDDHADSAWLSLEPPTESGA